MIVSNDVYIVYGQDIEGRDAEHYYFLDKIDACKFAMENYGRMAYGIPTVRQITASYDTNNMWFRKYDDCCHTLSKDEIQHYAKEFKC